MGCARAVTGWPNPHLQDPTLGPQFSKPSAYTDADTIGPITSASSALGTFRLSDRNEGVMAELFRHG